MNESCLSDWQEAKWCARSGKLGAAMCAQMRGMHPILRMCDGCKGEWWRSASDVWAWRHQEVTLPGGANGVEGMAQRHWDCDCAVRRKNSAPAIVMLVDVAWPERSPCIRKVTQNCKTSWISYICVKKGVSKMSNKNVLMSNKNVYINC